MTCSPSMVISWTWRSIGVGSSKSIMVLLLVEFRSQESEFRIFSVVDVLQRAPRLSAWPILTPDFCLLNSLDHRQAKERCEPAPIAQPALDWVLADVAVAAQHLHRPIGHEQ